MNARDKSIQIISYSGTISANSTIALNYLVRTTGPQRVIAGSIKVASTTLSKLQFSIRGEGNDKEIPSKILLCTPTASTATVRAPMGEGYTPYNKDDTAHLAWVTNIGTGAVEYVANIQVITLTDLGAVTFKNMTQCVALPISDTTENFND